MAERNSDQVPSDDDNQYNESELTREDVFWLYRRLVRKIVGGNDVDRQLLAELMAELGVSAEQLAENIDRVRTEVDDSHRHGVMSELDDAETRLQKMFEQARLALA